jgi:hypothetical protein
MGRKKKRLRLVQARKKNTVVVVPKAASKPKVNVTRQKPKKVVEATPVSPRKEKKRARAPKVTKLQFDLTPVESKKPTNN